MTTRHASNPKCTSIRCPACIHYIKWLTNGSMHDICRNKRNLFKEK